MRMSILGLLLIGCLGGCYGFPFFFGGQNAEMAKDKTETRWNLGGNKFSGGTTALEAAQADVLRMQAAEKIELIRKEAEIAKADASSARAWGDRWRDRAILVAVLAFLVAVFFPGAAAWIAARAMKAKNEALEAWDKLNEEHKKDLAKGKFE